MSFKSTHHSKELLETKYFRKELPILRKFQELYGVANTRYYVTKDLTLHLQCFGNYNIMNDVLSSIPSLNQKLFNGDLLKQLTNKFYQFSFTISHKSHRLRHVQLYFSNESNTIIYELDIGQYQSVPDIKKVKEIYNCDNIQESFICFLTVSKTMHTTITKSILIELKEILLNCNRCNIGTDKDILLEIHGLKPSHALKYTKELFIINKPLDICLKLCNDKFALISIHGIF